MKTLIIVFSGFTSQTNHMIISQTNQIVTRSSPNANTPNVPVKFTLNLFGAFSAKNQLGKEIAFRDDKVRALLAYLVVERSRPHRRESLAELFWGQSPESRARQSLRMALTRLRQSLDEVPSFLSVTRQTVQVQLDPDLHEIDIMTFEQLVAKCTPDQARDLNQNPFVRDWMEKAVVLYRGNFLAGLTLPDSPQFDDWLMLMQGHFEQQALTLLDTLAEDALSNRQLDAAGRYAQRQLEIVPWLENAHRQWMRVFAQRGQWQNVQQQYQTCAQILASELGVEPELETLHLLEEIKLRKSQPQKTGNQVQAPIIPEVPHNLPQIHTPFFGRESERGKLIRALLDDHFSLVTIVGPGGVGKTRLSTDIARHILYQPAFSDGVWFVQLDGLRKDDANLYEAIASTIATTLDIELLKPTDPHEQLFEVLQSRKMLLILDNFEQLISDADDGVDFVLDLLERTSQIKVMASSRRALNVQMEAVITLDGLPVPPSADESAYTYSSVQLFAERAQRANQHFVLDAGTLPEVVQICQLMEGVPLGLELVAVRLREMNCQQIIQALHTSLDLLRTRLRDLPMRHRSLRAVFDWSWSLLTKDEQRVLTELSVFRGSFSLVAAQAVTLSNPEFVYALIGHSLIRVNAGRYSLHELMRQFAAEKLTQAEAVLARHSHYYLAFITARADLLIRQNLAQVTDEIQKEWENIHQAWDTAINTQNIHLLQAALTGLGHYLRNSGMLWLGEKLFQGATAYIAGEIKRIPPPERAIWNQLLGQLHLELARCMFWSAQYETCISNAHQVVKIGEILGNGSLTAGGMLEGGRAYWRLGEYDLARKQLENALELSPEDPWLRVQTLNSFGNLYIVQGQVNEATAYYQRALELQKETDIWSNRVQVLNNLATTFAYQARLKQTVALLNEVLATSKQFNQQFFQVTIYHNLGLVYSEIGQYALSEENFEQAILLSHKLQNRQIEAEIWLGLAQLFRRLGQFERSQAHLEQAFSLCRQFGEKKSESEALMQRALLDHALHRFDEALESSLQSLQIARELGPSELDTAVFITVGYCHLALKNFDDAKAAFETALEFTENLGNPLTAAEALAGLTQIHLAQSDLNEVSCLIEKCWQHSRERDNLMGTILPYNLYLALFHAFSVLNDPRGERILQEVQLLIRTQAETIADLEMRAMFLDQHVCNQLLNLGDTLEKSV
ncbi:MAG TPA: hypothetical protein DEH22_06640 [Chloroflexi bacterium]|nr:hypothetical protein [Chloroflexota bacterium]